MKTSVLVAALIFSVGLTGCIPDSFDDFPSSSGSGGGNWTHDPIFDVVYLDAPKLNSGECGYSAGSYKTETEAQAGLASTAAILADSSTGGFTVDVTRSQTYMSATLYSNPYYYSYQLVFSCNQATTKYERVENFKSQNEAEIALEQRLYVLNGLYKNKFISKGTAYSGETKVCYYVDTNISCSEYQNEPDCKCYKINGYYYYIRSIRKVTP